MDQLCFVVYVFMGAFALRVVMTSASGSSRGGNVCADDAIAPQCVSDSLATMREEVVKKQGSQVLLFHMLG